jgi:zinc transport system ATP-binding protein
MMKKTTLFGALTLLTLVAGACGGEQPGEEIEYCEHMVEGPAVTVNAVADGEGATVAADHKRYDVTLTSVARSVSLAADEAEDFSIALDKNIPLTHTDSSGNAIAIEETKTSDTGCSEVAVVYTAELPVGTATLTSAVPTPACPSSSSTPLTATMSEHGRHELLLEVEQLVVGYGGRGLLPPVSLQVRCGDFLTVIGRNGSGKSTLFRTLLGLLPPVSGRMVRAPGLKVAYIPQTATIDPLLPVRAQQLVGWGRMRGWDFLRPFASSEDRKARAAALEAVDAADLARQPYRELSEGQRQRVQLARVLASDAQLVVLDEPTSAMDAVAERRTLEQLARLARERHIAVVVVSHALEVPAEFADRVLFLDREGGEVIVGDTRTVFSHPAFRRRFGEAVVVPNEGPHAS